MEITNEEWIEKALKVHTIISLKISRQFIYAKDDQAKKTDLKKALALIDELDFLLESFPEQQASYEKTYRMLFDLLEKLALHQWVVNVLQGHFGTDCFFVRQALR